MPDKIDITPAEDRLSPETARQLLQFAERLELKTEVLHGAKTGLRLYAPDGTGEELAHNLADSKLRGLQIEVNGEKVTGLATLKGDISSQKFAAMVAQQLGMTVSQGSEINPTYQSYMDKLLSGEGALFRAMPPHERDAVWDQLNHFADQGTLGEKEAADLKERLGPYARDPDTKDHLDSIMTKVNSTHVPPTPALPLPSLAPR